MQSSGERARVRERERESERGGDRGRGSVGLCNIEVERWRERESAERGRADFGMQLLF